MSPHRFPGIIDNATRARAVRAAQGEIPFDLLIVDGTLVDVLTGELRKADVGVTGAMIASVHPPSARLDAAITYNAAGRWICPGFIDTHVHFETSHLLPVYYAEQVVAQGTTTIFYDPHELANVFGLDGVRYAIEASRGLPLRFLCAAPSCVPSAEGLETSGAKFGGGEMQEMLSWEDVAGVAEVMDMRGVLARTPRMVDVVSAGLNSGKLIEGHARGLAGPSLQAYLSAGVGSDHEITSGEDAVEKLRAGLAIEIRGSHDYVLPGVVEELRKLPQIPSQVSICTDDVPPDYLVEKGGVSDVLRRLVGYGMNDVDAIRCATFNASLRLRRPDLGAVCAGRIADIAVLNSLEEFNVESVFVAGCHVVERGQWLVSLHESTSFPRLLHSVQVPELREEDLQISSTASAAGTARVRAILGMRFAEWRDIEVKVRDGFLELPEDASMMYVRHRHGRHTGQGQCAIQLGIGRMRGAIATTYSHDSHNLVILGGSVEDMRAAGNALIRCGGGMAVAQGGAVLAFVEFPVGGLLSDLAPASLAGKFRALRDAASQVTDWKPPYWTFKAIEGTCLACNPGPHLTDLGLTDGTSHKLVSMFP
ncbi:MAG TPA: adenine deaminase C-terminal domain-containing protein [Candidatus Acidoferrum sp.]|nr:adenine deaminase C-terminal domain-containing protein [Candidatus Acidoferrum sp.]